MKKKIKDNKLVLYIILVAFAMVIVPHLLRYISGNPALIGEEGYLHERIAENILEGDFTRDTSVVGGRTLYYSPYHFLLAMIGLLTSLTAAAIILPLALGIGSALLFYKILEKFNIGSTERFVALCIFIVSPAFIYSFSLSTNHPLSLFFVLFSSWTYLKGGNYHKLAFISFIIASALNIFNGLLLSLLLIFLLIKTREDQKHIFFAVMLLAIIAFFIHPPFTSTYHQTTSSLITELVSDLGSAVGYGVFILMLAILGMIWAWPTKKDIYPLYITTITIIIVSYFTSYETLMYAAPLISIFAGIGIGKIKDFEWVLELLKHLTIWIIICGILFSSISYIARLPELNPSTDMIDALEELKDEIKEGDVVLSHHSNGYFIEHIADATVLTDSHMTSIDNIDEKLVDIHALFFTRDLEEAKDIFNKYSIDYIVVDKEMKQGLVWAEDEQGLLFLFRNTETFHKMYSNQEVDIWEVRS